MFIGQQNILFLTRTSLWKTQLSSSFNSLNIP